MGLRRDVGPPVDVADDLGLYAQALAGSSQLEEACRVQRDAITAARKCREWQLEVSLADKWLDLLARRDREGTQQPAYGVLLFPAHSAREQLALDLSRIAGAYRSLDEAELAQGALTRAMVLVGPGPTVAWSALVNQQAAMHLDRDRPEAAMAGHREAIHLARLAKAREAELCYLADLGFAEHSQGLTTAAATLEEIVTSRGLPRLVGWAERVRARVAIQETDFDAAQVSLARALAAATHGDGPLAYSQSAYAAALLATIRSDPAASEYATRALSASRHVAGRTSQVIALERNTALLRRIAESQTAADDVPLAQDALQEWCDIGEPAASATTWARRSGGYSMPTSMSESSARAVHAAQSFNEGQHYARAIELARPALATALAADDLGGSFLLRKTLIESLAGQGDLTAAEAELSLLAASARSPRERLLAAIVAAQVADGAGQPARGIPDLSHQIKACLNEPTELRPLLVVAHTLRGGLYGAVNNGASAEADYQWAWDNCAPDDNGTRATIMRARGRAAEAIGDHRTAFEFMSEALQFARAANKEVLSASVAVDYARVMVDHDPTTLSAAAAIWQAAAETFARYGDRLQQGRALEHLRSSGLADDIDDERWSVLQAELRLGAGNAEDIGVTLLSSAERTADHQRAVALIEQAVTALRQVADPRFRMQAMHELVERLLAIGEPEQQLRAVEVALELVELVEQYRGTLETVALRQTFLENYGGAYGLCAFALLTCVTTDDEEDRSEQAFAVAELGRARALADATAERPVDPARVSALRAELARATESLNELRGKGAASTEITRVSLKVGQLDRAIAVATKNIGVRRTYTEGDVRAWLGRDTALLSFVGVGSMMLCFCVTDTTFWATTIEESRSRIERRAAEMTRALELRTKRYPHANSLYQSLLVPVLEVIAHRDVVVVADGALQQLPWAALLSEPPRSEESLQDRWESTAESPDAEDHLGGLKHEAPPTVDDEQLYDLIDPFPKFASARNLPYALRDRAFSICPSIATFIEIRSRTDRSRRPATILAIADPLTRGRSTSLRELPRSADEARSVSQVYDRRMRRTIGAAYDSDLATIRLRELATRDELLAQLTANRKDVVHISSHVLINAAEPLLSHVVLSGDHGDLALSDVLDLDLLDVRVVLSCCDSGTGTVIGGEGVVGLARGFLIAGARCVCATLWQVLDAETPDLMRRFHEHLHQGEPAPSALRAAQLAWIRSQNRKANTAAWSAFVLIGT